MVVKWAPTESLAGWPGLSTVGLFCVLREGFKKKSSKLTKKLWQKPRNRTNFNSNFSGWAFLHPEYATPRAVTYGKAPHTDQNNVQNPVFQAVTLVCGWYAHQLLGNIMSQTESWYIWFCSIGCKILTPVNSVLHLKEVSLGEVFGFLHSVLCLIFFLLMNQADSLTWKNWFHFSTPGNLKYLFH